MSMPTTERLAAALTEAGAPAEMIERARQGFYDDFKSPWAMPTLLLVDHCRDNGLLDVMARVIDGEFDSTPAESEEWAASPEGQETFRQLFGGQS